MKSLLYVTPAKKSGKQNLKSIVSEYYLDFGKFGNIHMYLEQRKPKVMI